MKRGRKAKCIWCHSHRTISKGYRPTETMGKRSLRVCKDCGRKFTVGRVGVVSVSGVPTVPSIQITTPAPESLQAPVPVES